QLGPQRGQSAGELREAVLRRLELTVFELLELVLDLPGERQLALLGGELVPSFIERFEGEIAQLVLDRARGDECDRRQTGDVCALKASSLRALHIVRTSIVEDPCSFCGDLDLE